MARDPKNLDRRAFIKGLGAAGLAPLVPGCASETPDGTPDPTPAPVTPGDPSDVIDTVVVVMLENRSFDNYFGAYSLVEGRDDIDGLQPGMSNPDLDGNDVPIYAADVTSLDDSCVEDPPHSWNTSRVQFSGGTNEGFVIAHADRHGAEVGHRPMQYWTRDTLSALYAMADRHVICDRWFCSQLSSTWPNRFYSHAAQNGGVHGNDPAPEPFPSIYPRLEAAGKTWGNYYANAPSQLLLPDLPPSDNFKGIEEFWQDAAWGVLPNVTIVEPAYGVADDHPPAHPVAGQIFLSAVYDALKNSPQWERMLVVFTYDEHGGFYDHVPPPRAADERADEDFDQLGFRVPTVLAGPWVKESTVSSQIYDHTSILAFMERLWDIEPLTLRDEAANDLWEEFDLDRIGARDPVPAAEMPVIEADEDEIYAEQCAALNGLFRDEGEGITRQPLLEAYLDEHLLGTRFDRREQTLEIWQDILDHAAGRGLWRRK